MASDELFKNIYVTALHLLDKFGVGIGNGNFV
jgi:hypothetical protein